MRLLLLLLLFLPMLVSAQGGHMVLLTVAEDLESVGGTADLYLEIEPGDGSIFIDSFPLTRLDTQGSTRYANQIACDFLDEDCSRYDFYYTIRAPSAIVGGPSAGAAISVLTVAVLDGRDIDESIALTGTINSGGIIGPVGGIAQKVKGAKDIGLTKVLIPSLSVLNATNVSAPEEAVQSLSDADIAVVRVATIEDALFEFTGHRYERNLPPIEEPEDYQVRMRQIAADICNRTESLSSAAEELDLVYEDSNNYTQRITMIGDDRAYTRASLCFSANIELNRLVLSTYSDDEVQELNEELATQALALRSQVREWPIDTIADLEVYAIVHERLRDAERLLLQENDSATLAYAQERLISAQSWSRFYGLEGKKVALDDTHLHRACQSKIIEAEERVNYVRLYAEGLVETSAQTLQDAYRLAESEPVLCIFTASLAKAQANTVASALFIDETRVDELIDAKLDAGEIVIRTQLGEGFFPLQGYSYLRYAQDLKEEQPYSALTFAEYALELSNLESYFPVPRRYRIPSYVWDVLVLLGCGAIFGAAATMWIMRKVPERSARRKRRTVPSREKR